MAGMEEMEAAFALCKVNKAKQAEVADDFESEELLIYQDVRNALTLLHKCVHMLDYMADTDTCKSVSKRERDNMDRLSQQVKEFLEDTEGNYEDE